MSTRLAPALIVCLLVGATPALAHSPIMGIGGVPGGALHAWLIPEHGLSLLALGLVLGLHGKTPRHIGLAIFLTALIGGLIAAAFALGEAFAADVLLSVTGILGVLVVIAWAPPVVSWSFAAIAGLAIGLDSRPEVAPGSETVLMLIGSGLGAAFAVALVSEVSYRLKGAAQLIVARVLGSWITAIAILVLSLRIATQIALG